MVVAYCAICLLLTLTLILWFMREQQFHKERMEMLKLIKASSLSEFTAEKQTAPENTNYLRSQIKKAYQHGGDE